MPALSGSLPHGAKAGTPGLNDAIARELTTRLACNPSTIGCLSVLGASVASPDRTGMEKAVNFGHCWNAVDQSSLGLTVDPSKGGLALQGVGAATSQCLPRFPSNSSFAERAARFSAFGNGTYSLSFPLTDNGKVRHTSNTPEGDSAAAKSSTRSSHCDTTGGKFSLSQVHGSAATEGSANERSKGGKNGKADIKSALQRSLKSSSYPPLLEIQEGERSRDSTTEEEGAAPGYSATESEGQCTQGTEPVVLDAAPAGASENRGRKRKTTADVNCKDALYTKAASPGVRDAKEAGPPSKYCKSGDEKEDLKISKAELTSSDNSEGLSPQSTKENAKSSEQPKLDYIHVRARRGQATDSHSLAERVRREKISERMKYLQDLVPGCSKVTGKAVMLDEIINYVQSIQRQVEFLSMKLAAVTPRPDFNMDSFLAKEVGVGMAGTVVGPEANVSYPDLHAQQQVLMQQGNNCGVELQSPGRNIEAALRRMNSIQPASRTFGDTFGDSMPQVSRIWDGELQSVVQMGFNQSRSDLVSNGIHCELPPGHMKVEL